MACDITHEIKNPLTAIRLQSELLRFWHGKSQFSDIQIIDGLLKIEAWIEHLNKTIDGISNFARNSERDSMSISQVYKLITDTVSIARARLEKADIQIRIATAPSLKINCRPSELSQVLLNLLDNAYDAVILLKERWISLTTKVKIEKDQSWIVIMIEDSGKGIPPTVSEKFMRPFFTTKRVNSGTGLGLHISKRIIENHGGRFIYDSNCSNT